MLNARQCEYVAVYDGGFHHLDCHEAWGLADAEYDRRSEEASERAGVPWKMPSPVDIGTVWQDLQDEGAIGAEVNLFIRYNIEEQESYELESDVEYLLDLVTWEHDPDERGGVDARDLFDRFTDQVDDIIEVLADEDAIEDKRTALEGWLYDHAYDAGYGRVHCDSCGNPIE
jgi:hypothetical protein